jgi:hypothetical protein
MNPLWLDEFKVPVTEEWKKAFAKGIRDTARAREESWTEEGDVKGYGKTIAIAGYLEVEDPVMAELVIYCLQTHWNDSLKFAQKYGYSV